MQISNHKHRRLNSPSRLKQMTTKIADTQNCYIRIDIIVKQSLLSSQTFKMHWDSKIPVNCVPQ